MFKIAFICPGYENLGLEYLSAVLKQNGFKVELFLDPIIFDESGFVKNRIFKRLFGRDRAILKSIVDFQPSLVGMPVLSDNFLWACKWARLIKECLRIPVVLGGIHPTSVPESAISNRYIDYICVGEGEEAMLELCQSLSEKKDISGIRNIWHKSGDDIVSNPVRPPLELDNLPFPDKDLFFDKYPFFRYGYKTSTSRGCVYRCAYCCNNIMSKLYNNRFYRQRSADNVIEELKLAKKKYRSRFIHFVDEVFNVNQDWLKEFLDLYKKEIDLPFDCYVYPDLVSADLVDLLKKSGCFKVQMGVQTVNEQKRKQLLKRESSNQKIKQAILAFRNSGIFVSCDNILGLPGEAEDDLFSMYEFYDEYTPDYCELFWLRFYPETDITLESIKNNYLSSGDYADIKDGKLSGGLFSSASGKLARRYSFLLKSTPYISRPVRKMILKTGILNLVPYIPSDILIILSKLIKKPKYDIYTQRTFSRYWHFVIREGLGRKRHEKIEDRQ